MEFTHKDRPVCFFGCLLINNDKSKFFWYFLTSCDIAHRFSGLQKDFGKNFFSLPLLRHKKGKKQNKHDLKSPYT